MEALFGSHLIEIGSFVITMAHAFVIVGALFIIAEAFAPGANSMVFGTGLLVAGLIGMGTGLGMKAKESDFFLLSLIALVVGLISFYFYRLMLNRHGGEKHTTSSSEDLKGKTGRVMEKVTVDSGRVRIRGVGSNPDYQARCEEGEIEPETKVRVIDPGGGSILIVEPVPGNE